MLRGPFVWLLLWHEVNGKHSAIRFRVPGQFWLAMRVYRASRRLHDDARLSVEW